MKVIFEIAVDLEYFKIESWQKSRNFVKPMLCNALKDDGTTGK